MENQNTIPESYIDLMVKYFGGTATEEEKQELASLIRSSEALRDEFQRYRNLWDASRHTSVSADQALLNTLDRISSREKPVLKLISLWQKVAAILVIPLLISAIWFFSAYYQSLKSDRTLSHTVYSSFGSITEINLPDGSKVWLNTGSRLKYPERFDNKSRTVELSGEAFFEVKSDAGYPFHVIAGDFMVKATGTRFNVMAYENSPQYSFALAEGKIDVSVMNSPGKMQRIARLDPSQILKYDISRNKFQKISEDPYKYFSWKDGKMVFRNDPLGEMVYRIGLQYNVDVEVKDDQIRNQRFYATFQNQSVTEVFDLLKLSSPIDYVIHPQKVLPDGSYTRKKIVIYSKSE